MYFVVITQKKILFAIPDVTGNNKDHHNRTKKPLWNFDIHSECVRNTQREPAQGLDCLDVDSNIQRMEQDGQTRGRHPYSLLHHESCFALEPWEC